MSDLSAFTNEQLLAELITRHKSTRAPWKIIQDGSTAREIIVGIGKDESARIIFHEPALKELGLK